MVFGRSRDAKRVDDGHARRRARRTVEASNGQVERGVPMRGHAGQQRKSVVDAFSLKDVPGARERGIVRRI
jgi:hypothetical protein